MELKSFMMCFAVLSILIVVVMGALSAPTIMDMTSAEQEQVETLLVDMVSYTYVGITLSAIVLSIAYFHFKTMDKKPNL